jgi:hypothetical protein
MQEADAAILAAQNALAEARASVERLTRNVRIKRIACADAISNWQRSFPPIDRCTMVRQQIAADQARRLADAPPVDPNAPPERSYIDRAASYASGGTADDFARKFFRNGGCHRGGLPRSMVGRKVR